MQVVCVCGMGMGTSLIMKMTVDKALRELGVEAEIEHWDAGTVGGKPVDLIVTSEDFAERFADRTDVVYLKNVLNAAEAKEKLRAYLEAHKG